MWPSWIGSRVLRTRIVVVLPAPFGPSRPKISPCSMRRSMPSTAACSPKRCRRPSISSAGAVSGIGAAPSDSVSASVRSTSTASARRAWSAGESAVIPALSTATLRSRKAPTVRSISSVSSSRATLRSLSSARRISIPASVSWRTSVLTVLPASPSSSAARVTDTPGRRRTRRTRSSWAPVSAESSTGRVATRRPLRRMAPIAASRSSASAGRRVAAGRIAVGDGMPGSIPLLQIDISRTSASQARDALGRRSATV